MRRRLSRLGTWIAFSFIATATACGENTGPGMAFNGSIVVDGSARTFSFFAPEISDGETLPLILVFHGGGSTAAGMQRISLLEPFARERGFALAYPDAVFGLWAHGCDCTVTDSLGVNDVGFVAALIDSLSRAFPIDPERIYVAGLSMGGLFTHRARVR